MYSGSWDPRDCTPQTPSLLALADGFLADPRASASEGGLAGRHVTPTAISTYASVKVRWRLQARFPTSPRNCASAGQCPFPGIVFQLHSHGTAVSTCVVSHSRNRDIGFWALCIADIALPHCTSPLLGSHSPGIAIPTTSMQLHWQVQKLEARAGGISWGSCSCGVHGIPLPTPRESHSAAPPPHHQPSRPRPRRPRKTKARPCLCRELAGSGSGVALGHPL